MAGQLGTSHGCSYNTKYYFEIKDLSVMWFSTRLILITLRTEAMCEIWSQKLIYSSVLDCLAVKVGITALIIQWENNSGDKQTKQDDCSRKYWDILNPVGIVHLY